MAKHILNSFYVWVSKDGVSDFIDNCKIYRFELIELAVTYITTHTPLLAV